MHRILLPVDRNEDRIGAQTDYVLNSPLHRDEIEVTVLHVLGREDASTTDEENLGGNEAAVEAANRLEGAGITVNRSLSTGQPVAEQILESGDEIDADVIVMSGRKRSGVSQVLLGSTAKDVTQKANRPVVMVG